MFDLLCHDYSKRNMPDLELESLFKKNFTQVTFLQGSIMNTKDLERAKVTRILSFRFFLKASRVLIFFWIR